jgi:hypothetical protein
MMRIIFILLAWPKTSRRDNGIQKSVSRYYLSRAMYWRLKSIPELRDLPVEQPRRLWQQAFRTPFRGVDFLWLLGWFIPLVPLIWLLVRLDGVQSHRWIIPVAYFAFVLFVQRYSFIIFAFRARPVLRRLREEYEPSVSNPPSWVSGHRYYCVFGAALCILAAPMLLGQYLDGASRTWQGLLFGTILIAAAMACFGAATFGEWRARRRVYRQAGGLCVSCGYDLRAASSDRCPECGERL